MASYTTIDTYPDLSRGDMVDAIPLTLSKYTPTQNGIPWDNNAVYVTTAPYALLDSIFTWQGKEGATYDIFSSSFWDPFLVTVYDAQGNVIAVDVESGEADGYDVVWDFKAPYSGTYYVSAGWDQGSNFPEVSLSIYEDIDTIQRQPEPSPPQNITQGTERNDKFTATAGEDKINGRAGFDTVTYSGKQSDHVIIKNGSTVTVGAKGGATPVDVLSSIEALQFSNGTVDFEYTDVVQALYIAYFGRAADTFGLKNFQVQLTGLTAPKNIADLSARYYTDAGVANLINSFSSSAESSQIFGGKDTKTFINTVYQNVFERAPDADGLRFWTEAIDSGALTKANASLSIMAAALTNTTQQGQLDGILVNNKINVATNFTFAVETAGKDGGYSGNAAAAMVRNLLIDVNASTDIAAFQQKVVNTVNSLPISSTWEPAQADPGQAEVIGSMAADSAAVFF